MLWNEWQFKFPEKADLDWDAVNTVLTSVKLSEVVIDREYNQHNPADKTKAKW